MEYILGFLQSMALLQIIFCMIELTSLTPLRPIPDDPFEKCAILT